MTCLLIVELRPPALTAIAYQNGIDTFPETLGAAAGRRALGLAGCVASTVWLVAGVLASGAPLRADDQLAHWIQQLDADRYALRERARRYVASYGAAAVAPLLSAVSDQRPELVRRAVDLLVWLGHSGDAQARVAAQQGLEQLAKRPELLVARSAAWGLARLGRIQQRRVVRTIEANGGRVFANNTWGDEAQVSYVILGKGWQGDDTILADLHWLPELEAVGMQGTQFTDASVQRLRSLPNLRLVQLYGTSVSDVGEALLKSRLPQARIDRRAGALLGIQGSRNSQGCQVEYVRPNTAAARAAIVPGDVITRFDGRAVDTFEALTALIAKRRPGTRARLEILREGATFEVEVVMGQIDVEQFP